MQEGGCRVTACSLAATAPPRRGSGAPLAGGTENWPAQPSCATTPHPVGGVHPTSTRSVAPTLLVETVIMWARLCFALSLVALAATRTARQPDAHLEREPLGYTPEALADRVKQLPGAPPAQRVNIFSGWVLLCDAIVAITAKRPGALALAPPRRRRRRCLVPPLAHGRAPAAYRSTSGRLLGR